MPCQTCGKTGHNTATCPLRKHNNACAKVVGGAAGFIYGVPAGSFVAGKIADAVQETAAQKQYRQRKANGK